MESPSAGQTSPAVNDRRSSRLRGTPQATPGFYTSSKANGYFEDASRLERGEDDELRDDDGFIVPEPLPVHKGSGGSAGTASRKRPFEQPLTGRLTGTSLKANPLVRPIQGKKLLSSAANIHSAKSRAYVPNEAEYTADKISAKLRGRTQKEKAFDEVSVNTPTRRGHSRFLDAILNNHDPEMYSLSWSNLVTAGPREFSLAIQHLINLICECAGLGIDFVPRELIYYLRDDKEKKAKLLSWIEAHLPTHTADAACFPLSHKGYYKPCRTRLYQFFSRFLKRLDLEIVLGNSAFVDAINGWIIPLSWSRVRRIRYSAAIAVFGIVEGYLRYFRKVTGEEMQFKKQLKSEIRQVSLYAGFSKNKAIPSLVEQLNARKLDQRVIERFFNERRMDFFDYKIRDASVDIRVEVIASAIRWYSIVPLWLVKAEFFNHISHALSDKSPEVKVKAIEFYKLIVSDAKNFLDKKLCELVNGFIEDSKEEVVGLAFDANIEVQKASLSACVSLAKMNFLIKDLITTLYGIIWIYEDEDVGNLIAEFVDFTFFSNSILRDDNDGLIPHNSEVLEAKTRRLSSELLSKCAGESEAHTLLQLNEIKEILDFLNLHLPSVSGISTNSMSTNLKAIHLLDGFIKVFWKKAPCIRNISLLMECICVNEARESPLPGFEDGFRTLLLQICELSFRAMTQFVKEKPKGSSLRDLSSSSVSRYENALNSGVKYVIHHAHKLITLHKSDAAQLVRVLSIISVCLENERLADHLHYIKLTTDLIKVVKDSDLPAVFKGSMGCLSSILGLVDSEDVIAGEILKLKDFLEENFLMIFIKWRTNLQNPASLENIEISSLFHRFTSFMQRLTNFYAVMPNSWIISEKCVDACLHFINTLKDGAEKTSHPATCVTKESEKKKQSESTKILLGCYDLLMVSYEKEVFNVVSLIQSLEEEKETALKSEPTVSIKLNGGKDSALEVEELTDTHAYERQVVEGEISDFEDSKVEKQNKDSTLDFIEKEKNIFLLMEKALGSYERLNAIFFSVLSSTEENNLEKLEAFLALMTLYKLEAILLSYQPYFLFSHNEFVLRMLSGTLSEKDESLLFDTLNGFLRDVEIAEGADEHTLNSHELKMFQNDSSVSSLLFPAFSGNVFLEIYKNGAAYDEIRGYPGFEAAQRLHNTISCCQFVVDCNNPKVWQSNLGTLILIQINMSQPKVALQAGLLMQKLKKTDSDLFFHLVLKSITMMNAAVKSHDLTESDALAFSYTVALRLGFTLEKKMKISFCKFLFNGLMHSLNKTANQENLLDLLYPFATRGFLNKQDVEFLMHSMKREINSSGSKFTGSKAELFISILLKKKIPFKEFKQMEASSNSKGGAEPEHVARESFFAHDDPTLQDNDRACFVCASDREDDSSTEESSDDENEAKTTLISAHSARLDIPANTVDNKLKKLSQLTASKIPKENLEKVVAHTNKKQRHNEDYIENSTLETSNHQKITGSERAHDEAEAVDESSDADNREELLEIPEKENLSAAENAIPGGSSLTHREQLSAPQDDKFSSEKSFEDGKNSVSKIGQFLSPSASLGNLVSPLSLELGFNAYSPLSTRNVADSQLLDKAKVFSFEKNTAESEYSGNVRDVAYPFDFGSAMSPFSPLDLEGSMDVSQLRNARSCFSEATSPSSEGDNKLVLSPTFASEKLSDSPTSGCLQELGSNYGSNFSDIQSLRGSKRLEGQKRSRRVELREYAQSQKSQKRKSSKHLISNSQWENDSAVSSQLDDLDRIDLDE